MRSKIKYKMDLFFISSFVNHILIQTTSELLLVIKEQFLPQPFKCQPDKMVKHTQTIRRQQPKNCLNVLDYFVGLALNDLTVV